MLIEKLQAVLDHRDNVDAELVELLFATQDLVEILFRTVKLAIFSQMQLERLAAIVPAEHAAEAQMMVRRGNEVGEAVASEFETWLGPGDAKRLAAIVAGQCERGNG